MPCSFESQPCNFGVQLDIYLGARRAPPRESSLPVLGSALSVPSNLRVIILWILGSRCLLYGSCERWIL